MASNHASAGMFNRCRMGEVQTVPIIEMKWAVVPRGGMNRRKEHGAGEKRQIYDGVV